MDIVSHALIGRALVTKNDKKADIVWVSFFGALPDVFQIPLYAVVGYYHNRPYYFPENADWTGFRSAHPGWSLLWEIPHSLFFLLLIVVPAVYLLKINKLAIVSYFLHIFVDLFTHTGEWNVKPFFPLNFHINGFTDAWAWDYYFFPITWAILLILIFILDKIRTRSK